MDGLALAVVVMVGLVGGREVGVGSKDNKEGLVRGGEWLMRWVVDSEGVSAQEDYAVAYYCLFGG